MIIDYNNCKEYINAKEIKLGKNIEIKEGTFISGMNKEAERVEIGDNVFIDKDCVILVPVFEIGDYGKIYKNCRISGYKPCLIGHNFWMDQNCILNSTDNLSIGNNVGIGAYSQLWTHIKHGDVLEGCRFNSTKELKIEDDVWFVGHCIVSPVICKKKSMAMVGSVITKDMEENHIYGGSPSVDLTQKVGPQFIERSIEEKLKLMKDKLDEFCQNELEGIEYIKIVDSFDQELNDKISYFNVSQRTYIKRNSDIEIKFMKFLLPLAKFIPAQFNLY